MNKSLEALERIVGCSIIESHTQKWQKDYYTIEEELRALEIIKNKKVDVDLLDTIIKDENQIDKLRSYNYWQIDKNKLTQEEFDLLKEVLL